MRVKTLAATAIMLLSLSGAASARDVWSLGGRVEDFAALAQQARMSGEELRLRQCDSACTMFLAANACVYPNTRLGFHMAFRYGPRGEHIHDGYGAAYDQLMWSHYPPGVRRALGRLTPQMRVLTGRQLMALGVRACGY